MTRIDDVLAQLSSLRLRGVAEAAEAVGSTELSLLPWEGAQTLDHAVDHAVAMANARGGRVVFGVEGDGRLAGARGADPGLLIREVFARTRPGLRVDAQLVPAAEVELLVMAVHAAPSIHATADGRRLRRQGRENLPLTPDQDAEVMGSRAEVDPGASPWPGATLADLDPLQIAYVREILRRKNDQGEILGLTDGELLSTLGLLSEEGEPLVAALLLLGKKEFLTRHLPQVEVVYLHYGKGDEPDLQEHLVLPLLHSLSRLTDLIEARNHFVTLKQGLFHHKIKDFDEEVYREALVNAYVHRDYTRRDGAVYVHHHPDRMEILNPGGFIGGVRSDNILYHAPRHRNRRLAEAFQHLGLMERGGHGVNRLYRLLLRRGKEPPAYHDTTDSVELSLQGGAMDEDFASFVAQEELRGQVFTLDFLIVLFHLRRHRTVDLATAASLCQRPARAVGSSLARMVDAGYIERITGRGGQTTGYRLSPRLYQVFRLDLGYFRDRGLQQKRQRALVLEVVEELGYIDLAGVQELCGIDEGAARALAQGLVSDGLLAEHRREGRLELVAPAQGGD